MSLSIFMFIAAIFFASVNGAEHMELAGRACYSAVTFDSSLPTASVYAPSTGTILGVSADYVSGGVTYDYNVYPPTKWGCTYQGGWIMVGLYKADGRVLYYPTGDTSGYSSISGNGYSLSGQTYDTNPLELRSPSYAVTLGEQFFFAYTESFKLESTGDNQGDVCADIYFIYDGRYISSSSATMVFDDAVDYCESRGYVVARPTTEEAFEDARQACMASGSDGCWVDFLVDKAFMHNDGSVAAGDYGFDVDGHAQTGTGPWYPGEPSFGCVHILNTFGFLYIDIQCDTQYTALCQTSTIIGNSAPANAIPNQNPQPGANNYYNNNYYYYGEDAKDKENENKNYYNYKNIFGDDGENNVVRMAAALVVVSVMVAAILKTVPVIYSRIINSCCCCTGFNSPAVKRVEDGHQYGIVQVGVALNNQATEDATLTEK
jgi:hypothetical protein